MKSITVSIDDNNWKLIYTIYKYNFVSLSVGQQYNSMCLPVQRNNCNHSSRPLATTSKTRAVRFVMKLPRYNPQPSTAAAGALRGDDQKNLHVEDVEKVTPPRQQQQQQPRRHSTSSSLTRRCQSANAVTRTRPRASFLPDMTKSRSHSQEPLRRRVGGIGGINKTEALPITPTGQAARPEGEGVGASGANVDKGDLTRMYDYATWNMYERIVTARRRRLANIDQETISSAATTSSSRRSSDVPSESSSPRSSNQEDSSGSGTTSCSKGQGQGTEVVYTTVPTKQSSSRPSQPQSSSTLKNSSSHDDSTMATADETDKSSTSSSSWSRTDSPAQFPFLANGNGIVPFPSLQRPMSCPPSGEHQASSGEDEHFIFPMDM